MVHIKKKKKILKEDPEPGEELNWLTRRLKFTSSSSKYSCRVLRLMTCHIFLEPSHPRQGARLMVRLCGARVCVCVIIALLFAIHSGPVKSVGQCL